MLPLSVSASKPLKFQSTCLPTPSPAPLKRADSKVPEVPATLTISGVLALGVTPFAKLTALTPANAVRPMFHTLVAPAVSATVISEALLGVLTTATPSAAVSAAIWALRARRSAKSVLPKVPE